MMLSAFFHIFVKCCSLNTAFVMIFSAAIALFAGFINVLLGMAPGLDVLLSFK